MTDRKKLKQLIYTWIIEPLPTDSFNPHSMAEHFADYLISKGVTSPVRCGECESYDTEGFCYWWKECVRDNDFCSYGERKEDES